MEAYPGRVGVAGNAAAPRRVHDLGTLCRIGTHGRSAERCRSTLFAYQRVLGLVSRSFQTRMDRKSQRWKSSGYPDGLLAGLGMQTGQYYSPSNTTALQNPPFLRPVLACPETNAVFDCED